MDQARHSPKLQRVKHATVVIQITEYDPDAQSKGHDDDTRFTVRADTVQGAVEKAIKRLTAFKD